MPAGASFVRLDFVFLVIVHSQEHLPALALFALDPPEPEEDQHSNNKCHSSDNVEAVRNGISLRHTRFLAESCWEWQEEYQSYKSSSAGKETDIAGELS